nr:hypothetical protein [Nostoc sp. EkiNYC01]
MYNYQGGFDSQTLIKCNSNFKNDCDRWIPTQPDTQGDRQSKISNLKSKMDKIYRQQNFSTLCFSIVDLWLKYHKLGADIVQ